MSKIAEKKRSQGYTEHGPNCAKCAHFTFDTKPIPWMQKENDRIEAGNAMSWDVKRDLSLPEHRMECNFRCNIGGFAVKKMGWCPQWAEKPAQ